MDFTEAILPPLSTPITTPGEAELVGDIQAEAYEQGWKAGAASYRDLLKRYIEHVGDYEGTTFIHQWAFRVDEYAELKRLEDEVWPDE